MKSCNCPSCGAKIDFQSSLSVYAVCKYCQSMVVRRDLDVESIGKMAALPDDMSPLQIGTRGKFLGIGFGIIGRMKLSWSDGFWNEWFVIFDDGRKGWLAEAQGAYAVSFEIDKKEFAGLKKLKNIVLDKVIGRNLVLEKKILKIVDIKEAICAGSQGELPYAAPVGRKTTSIDLVGEDGDFASIEVAEGESARVYMGKYVTWEEMHCENFRILEGW